MVCSVRLAMPCTWVVNMYMLQHPNFSYIMFSLQVSARLARRAPPAFGTFWGYLPCPHHEFTPRRSSYLPTGTGHGPSRRLTYLPTLLSYIVCTNMLISTYKSNFSMEPSNFAPCTRIVHDRHSSEFCAATCAHRLPSSIARRVL